MNVFFVLQMAHLWSLSNMLSVLLSAPKLGPLEILSWASSKAAMASSALLWPSLEV